MIPIEGMRHEPTGLEIPFMVGAWLGLVEFLARQPDVVEQFKADTGHSLKSILSAKGFDKLIDEATGHQRTVIIAWCDWVTEWHWGIDGQEPDWMKE